MSLDDNLGQNVASTEAPPESCRFPQVAAWLHTILIVAILFGVSYLSAKSQHRYPGRGQVATYVTTIAYEWALVGIVVLGIRRRGVRLRDIIGGRWRTGSVRRTSVNVLRDVGIAIVFLIGSRLILGIVAIAAGLANPQALAETKQRLAPLAPHTAMEFSLFLLVSLTAGFCEEIVCRGYLQRQFTALTQNITAGIVLQGIVFGVSHGYQGAQLMLVLTVFGILFGILVFMTKNLRSSMIAHGLNDAVSGVVLYYMGR